MNPQTTKRVLEAMRNHRRPPRTLGARVRDALAHAHNADKRNPEVDGLRASVTSVGIEDSDGREKYSATD